MTKPCSLFVLAALISTTVLSLSACKGDHQDVVDEKKEARTEIQAKEREVVKQEQEASKSITEAAVHGDAEAIAKEKVEATREIADAKKEVNDEKVEATEEITEAEKSAGESTGTYQRK